MSHYVMLWIESIVNIQAVMKNLYAHTNEIIKYRGRQYKKQSQQHVIYTRDIHQTPLSLKLYKYLAQQVKDIKKKVKQ